jgi:hypothetical protein
MEEVTSTRLCGEIEAVALAGMGCKPHISQKSSLFQGISG